VDYLAGLGGGGDYRGALATAYAAIREHETDLAARFLEGLTHLHAWRVWGVADPARMAERVPTFGLTHRTRPPEEVAATLGNQGIFAWHGHHYAPGLAEALGLGPDGTLRVGFLHYNTPSEVDRLLGALGEVKE
jgi:selenocysteine lyase/cysteine desulfurase